MNSEKEIPAASSPGNAIIALQKLEWKSCQCLEKHLISWIVITNTGSDNNLFLNCFLRIKKIKNFEMSLIIM